MNNNIKLISGTSNPKLAQEISQILNIPLSKVKIENFTDSETYVKIEENMRGQDVFIIQSTCQPVNNNLIELLIMIDAIKRASADRITAVIPYFGYARQDRKTESREPISAKLVANLITAAGANRVLTIDLHADQIQGFFDIPVDHLLALPLIANYFKEKAIEDLVVVSPDIGAVKINTKLANKLGVPIVMIVKQRSEHEKIGEMKILGDIKNKNVVMTDDLISTAGTLINAAKILKENGAKKIYLSCTHPVLVGPAKERLNNECIEEVIVTNTIPQDNVDKIKVLSIAPLLSEAIRRIHFGESVSSLFD